MDSNITKGIRRNRFVYAFLRITIGWLVCLFRGYSYKKCKTGKETALILANHNSDWDPLYLVIGLKRHMKYVASANILGGFIGKIITWLVNPIPRPKGAGADETVELIGKNLAAGVSVAMFPEGNKSWDGKTSFISERTAELLKNNHCSLITYRFDGDYLKTPRWAKYGRHGKVIGSLVQEYTADELEKMSTEEIYGIITRDLDVDAYAYQEAHHLRYRGKNKAEGFENLAYLCPKCFRFGTIRTAGDEISCTCGLHLVYDEYGYIRPVERRKAKHGKGLPKPPEQDPAVPGETLSWNRFQQEYVIRYAEELRTKTDEPLRTDQHCTLYRTEDMEKQAVMTEGTVCVYGDRIECISQDGKPVQTFYWRDVEKMGMFRNYSVYLTCHGKRYEIRRESGISGISYFVFWRIMTGKELY